MKIFISGTEIADRTLAYTRASVRCSCRHGPQLYSFIRRYSNTTYPIRAEITAMEKFAPVKISFKANVRLFPGPFVAVNSPHQEIGIEEKDDERDFNHCSPERGESPAIIEVRMHGRMIPITAAFSAYVTPGCREVHPLAFPLERDGAYRKHRRTLDCDISPRLPLSCFRRHQVLAFLIGISR
jgi:hypothetical protein